MQTDVLFHFLDEKTKEHCIRTQELSKETAKLLNPDEVFVMQVSIAARYHDIGKVYVPSQILQKPTQLSDEEFEFIKEHARNGFRIASEIFHDDICKMILYHHENEDGSGYYGKKSVYIPSGAQIIHVCDVYDALITKRSYHEPMEEQKVLDFINENKNRMFNEEVVEAFLDAKRQLNI